LSKIYIQPQTALNMRLGMIGAKRAPTIFKLFMFGARIDQET
jgi:hypothetical protein